MDQKITERNVAIDKHTTSSIDPSRMIGVRLPNGEFSKVPFSTIQTIPASHPAGASVDVFIANPSGVELTAFDKLGQTSRAVERQSQEYVDQKIAERHIAIDKHTTSSANKTAAAVKRRLKNDGFDVEGLPNQTLLNLGVGSGIAYKEAAQSLAELEPHRRYPQPPSPRYSNPPLPSTPNPLSQVLQPPLPRYSNPPLPARPAIVVFLHRPQLLQRAV